MGTSSVSQKDYDGLVRDVMEGVFTGEELRRKYAGIGEDTFNVLFAQAQNKLVFKRYRELEKSAEETERVCKGVLAEIEGTRRDDVAAEKAAELGMPPCLFLRVLIGWYFRKTGRFSEEWVHRKATSAIHDPGKVKEITKNELFNRNAVHSISSDHSIYSGKFEARKADAGRKGERMLEGELGRRKIPYYTEEYLQSTGEHRRPDVLLVFPILVGEEVVNWIESKNLFGDCSVYSEHRRSQLVPYVNRFGSGMVIYWSGCIEDLPPTDGVLVSAGFPENITQIVPVYK
ncbi:MAG: uncharacterized protein A8A55_0235 [Amphiamblys sp. WSBS2006]|nr:MAG: uncharacterized protein A8A55_0235 [Amphiamblys sp. WSBS2006]